jgi:hypothetical protein
MILRRTDVRSEIRMEEDLNQGVKRPWFKSLRPHYFSQQADASSEIRVGRLLPYDV